MSQASMKIGTRIGLAVLIPLVALALSSAYVMAQKWSEMNASAELKTLVGVATNLSALIHEMQKERGMSSVFIGSHGEQMGSDIPAQRAKVDAAEKVAGHAFNELGATRYAGQVGPALQDIRDRLAKRDGKRQAISALSIPASESGAYFTSTIGKLLDLIVFVANTSHDPDVQGQLFALMSFAQAKERAGQERAVGAAAFGAGKFTDAAAYRKFVAVEAEEQTWFRSFEGYASAEQVAFFKQTMDGPVSDEEERLRKVAEDAGPEGSLAAVSGKMWFDAMTAKINLMKTVEDRVTADIAGMPDAIYQRASEGFWGTCGVVGVLFVLTLGIGFRLVQSITTPIKELTEKMEMLAQGNLTVDVASYERRDEIGALSRAFLVFKRAAVDQAARTEAERKEVAVKEQRRLAMDRLTSDFTGGVDTEIGDISKAMGVMRLSVKTMEDVTQLVLNQASNVSEAAGQAASNVNSVAAAVEELSSSITEISQQVAQSTMAASQAVEQSSVADARITSLAQAADKIGTVVQLINDIASQTNLLALNATIEAARAGEAGKGFAVVASEVKALASQTARATDEISGHINAIQQTTSEAVTAIKSVSRTIETLSHVSGAVAAAVEEQSAATQEITRNVQGVAQKTASVTEAIADVAQAAGQAEQTVGSVNSGVATVAERVESVRQRVEGYTQAVRA